MRVLIFTNTPAHVHLYRNAIDELGARGHDVLALARDYGCTVDLLEWYGVPHAVYGRCDTTKYSLFGRLPVHYARILRTATAFDPDVIFGMGAYSAHTGAITRTRTILLIDSEPTTIDHLVSTPFADAVLTPASFRKDLGPHHYVFDGFKETAYLHPETFSHSPDVREALGVGDEPYALVRFNAFGSHHDAGKSGFTTEERRTLVGRLAESATVLVSDEGGDLDVDSLPARRFDLHPALMHDALAEASLLVADTQTMVTEAALLGTPAIRSNSFVGESDMGNFLELAERGLIFNYRSFDDVLETATDLLEGEDVGPEWRRKRDAYLEDKANLTDLIVDVATDPESVHRLDALRPRSRSEDHEESIPGRVGV